MALTYRLIPGALTNQVSYSNPEATISPSAMANLHVMIKGTLTKSKAFIEDVVVKEMSKRVERPIIFPLSNPTKLHEADPKNINDWSEGKALIVTGSPFPPVEIIGRSMELVSVEIRVPSHVLAMTYAPVGYTTPIT